MVNFNNDRGHDATTLSVLRRANPDKLVLGHLNINSIRNKFDASSDLIIGKIDIFLVTETKIDESFPKPPWRSG